MESTWKAYYFYVSRLNYVWGLLPDFREAKLSLIKCAMLDDKLSFVLAEQFSLPILSEYSFFCSIFLLYRDGRNSYSLILTAYDRFYEFSTADSCIWRLSIILSDWQSVWEIFCLAGVSCSILLFIVTVRLGFVTKAILELC